MNSPSMWPWDKDVRTLPDRVFRRLLVHPENLRELLAVLIPALIDRLDLSRLEVVPREFLIEDWRTRESDVILRIPFLPGEGEGSVMVCVMIEHQSTPDPSIPIRLFVYSALYWDRGREDWARNRRPGEPLLLNPILPIVFYTGQRPWTTNRRIQDLIHGPEELKQLAPQWPILFWDLAEHSLDELLGSSGQWLRSLAVVRAEREETEVFLDVLNQTVQGMKELRERDRPRWQELFYATLCWAVRRRPPEEIAGIKDIARAGFKPEGDREEEENMEKTFKTYEDTLLERGKTLGTIEGELKSYREILRDLLTDRFGELPSEILEKIAVADDLDRLKVAVRQVLHIDSLDELTL